jgi:hypothetical protein
VSGVDNLDGSIASNRLLWSRLLTSFVLVRHRCPGCELISGVELSALFGKVSGRER